ncbi:hypothetical protein AUK04_01575 [Candidatus Roizmanbacteria bacterium CG2_30_33_16]|uniref:HIT domain-containing protein n=3 Tax=Candidatus Roizmaniibacteriota TaxID=1752723 RepID=A0A2M7E4B4_9BACT|nr:MAG: hypothetical protein AUK04_01575 [Candidatus Roizmanbacteria bacterium CG2_30_33_16]PIV62548.1 MAG: hypothetical protein COS12_02015 [Candidatus Roizmanbacteria bacterium CG01_land_8_20_14_3_00_33_9]
MGFFVMDIFCKAKQKLTESIIEETSNFLILHDGFPLLKSHLLVIPKKHYRCFFEIDSSLNNELKSIKQKIYKFYQRIYNLPTVIFEHGIVGQTVLHAHLHFLPTKISLYKYLIKDFLPVKKTKVPYIYYKENMKETFFSPLKKIEDGYLHKLYAKILTRPKEQSRTANFQKWCYEVKKEWIFFLKRYSH